MDTANPVLSTHHLPPGPRWSLPTTLGLIRDPYQTLRQLRARYGDLVTFPSLNGKIVIAMTPELARPIVSAPPSTYGPWGAATIGEVLGQRSLLTTEGEVHRADRKLLTKPFRGERMRAYGEEMQAIAARRFSEVAEPGKEFEVLTVTTDITVDVILRAVFGVDDGPDFDEGRRLLYELAEISPLILFTKRSHTRLFPAYRRFQDTQQRFTAWLEKRIAEARERGEEGADILAMMLAARYDDGSALSDEDLRAHLVTLLFAGHETTAISLAWAVHRIWRDPELLKKLREELAAAGPATPEEIAKLPLLCAVCDEVLRLNPIVTENLRLLREPLELGDYTIPAGIGVGVAIATIHEDESLYPEPHQFRPERFLERTFSPFEYLPFGGGHRRCIGASFALYEMRLALAALLTSGLELELLAPDEKPARRTVTMGPEKGVPVRVVAC